MCGCVYMSVVKHRRFLLSRCSHQVASGRGVRLFLTKLCVCVYIYLYIYMCVYTRVYIHVCVCVYVFVRQSVRDSLRKCQVRHTFACARAHTHTHTLSLSLSHTHTHIHTHTQRLKDSDNSPWRQFCARAFFMTITTISHCYYCYYY